jgi:hypothetical protein
MLTLPVSFHPNLTSLSCSPDMKEEPEMQETPFVIEHVNGDAYAFDGIRKITDHHLEGKNKTPGSGMINVATILLAVLGAGLFYVSFSGQYVYLFAARHKSVPSMIEAAMLDTGMIVFTLLALGLSRSGKSSRTERLLILACSIGSAGMNYAAADDASPRSVIAYTAAPIFLAVVIDRVVAVVRRHVLGMDEASAWTALGSVMVNAARLAGMIVRYSLRFTVDAPATSRGLRQGIINAAPLPGIAPVVVPELPPSGLLCWCTNPLPCLAHGTAVPELPPTKKAALLVLYRGHKDYGNKTVASAVARELAPLAELQWGTARSYIGEELTRIEVAS